MIQRIDKQIALFIMASILYNMIIVRIIRELSSVSMFYGAEYQCSIIAYGIMIILFGVCFLENFGSGDELTSPYGVLRLVRVGGRKGLIIRFYIKQLVKSIFLSLVIYITYKFVTIFVNKSVKTICVIDQVSDVVFFIIIIFILLMFQSIIEIMFDKRWGLIAVFTIMICHLKMGDIVCENVLNEKWNLILFTNLAVSARRTVLNIEEKTMIIASFLWIVLIMTIFCVAFLKKDIYEKE